MSNAFSGGGGSNFGSGTFTKPSGPPPRGPPSGSTGSFGTGSFSGGGGAPNSSFGSSKPASGGFGTSRDFGASQDNASSNNHSYGPGQGPQQNGYGQQQQGYGGGGAPRGGFNPGMSQVGGSTGGYGGGSTTTNNNSQPSGGFKTHYEHNNSASNSFQGQNGGGYGQQKGGFQGGGNDYQGQNAGGYNGDQQHQNKGGFQGGGYQGPPTYNNSGGYAQQPAQQHNNQSGMMNGSSHSPAKGPALGSSFQATNNEEFQQMPAWNGNANSQQHQPSHQQQQYQQFNGGNNNAGGYATQPQQQQQPAQQRGGFQGGSTGGYGGYQGQNQQQQQQPGHNTDFNAASNNNNRQQQQYGGGGGYEKPQQQHAQPGLFSQHRNANTSENGSNFNQQPQQNGYTTQNQQTTNFTPPQQQNFSANQSVFTREAGFPRGATGGYGGGGYQGSSGAGNAGAGASGGGFQQGTRDFGASQAAPKPNFEAKADWNSPRSSPHSQSSGGFGTPKSSFGAPKRDFGEPRTGGGRPPGGNFGARSGGNNSHGGPPRRQQEAGFSNFGDGGSGGQEQQNSFGGPREFRHGGGGRSFGGNEAEGGQEGREEPKIERAPRDWLPKQAEIDQLYAYDHDVVEHFDDGADDEDLIVHNAEDRPINSWDNMGLDEHLIKTLKEKCRFVKPRKIQASIIPLVATGQDLIVQAVTGSGKTLSFVLPILDKIMKMTPEERKDTMRTPVAIVIEPTRELAGQVYDGFRRFTEGTDIRCVLGIGQKCRYENLKELVAGVDVLVATAGRCMDFFENGELSFDRLAYFVLDEGDRLLEPRDADHINKVIKSKQFVDCADKRQTFVFSATMGQSCVDLALKMLRQSKIICVKNSEGRKANNLVQHEFYELPGAKEKHIKLKEILQKDKDEGKTIKTLIFTEKRANANFLAFEIMNMDIVDCRAITGEIGQDTRDEVIIKFRNGELTVLVGTDVCSRGLDVNNLERVIQYDLPSTKVEGVELAADKFIHRVGRTGRNHKGIAISFVDNATDPALAKEIIKIVRSCNQEVPEFLVTLSENEPAPSSDGFGSAPAGFGTSPGFGTGFGSKGNSGFGTSGSGNFGNSGGFGGSNFGSSGGFGNSSAPRSSGGFGSGGTSGGSSGGSSAFGTATGGSFGGGGFGSTAAQNLGDFGSSGFGSLKLKKETAEETTTDVTEPKDDVKDSDVTSETPKVSAFAPTPPVLGSSGFGSKEDDVTGSDATETTGEEKTPAAAGSTSGTTLVVNDEKDASPFDEKPFKLPPGGVEEQNTQEDEDEADDDDVSDDATQYGTDEEPDDVASSEAGSTGTVLANELKEQAVLKEETGSAPEETGTDVKEDTPKPEDAPETKDDEEEEDAETDW